MGISLQRAAHAFGARVERKDPLDIAADPYSKENVPYVLTRGSRLEAALIPYEEFVRFQALQEQEILARFDRLVTRMAEQNADVSEEEVAADVAAARAELDG